jgi:hypothetical protein
MHEVNGYTHPSTEEEHQMSGGPIGQGQSYWATIKVSKQLSKKDLQGFVKEIRKVLKKHGGKIVAETRASSKAVSSFTLRVPDSR